MKCRFLQFILLGMLVPSINAQAVQGRVKWTITGRVVDNCGKPVSNARIYVVPTGPLIGTSIDNEIAGGDGRFHYQRESSVSGVSDMFLYVTAPFPINAYIPLNPPFYAVNRVDRSFTGQAIKVKTGEELNLGDVPVQVNYGVVVIHLQDRKGEPMFTDAENWEYIGIRVRDLNGKIVVQRDVSPASVKYAVRVKESAIAIMLPEGAWRIEIAPDGLKQKWPYDLKEPVLVTEMLLVKTSNSPLEVTLRPKSKH